MIYSNKDTCGMKKGNDFDGERFVSPLQPDCENQFEYFGDGRIEGDTYTIDLLNLNSPMLRIARKADYRSLVGLSSEDIMQIYDAAGCEFPAYYNVIRQFIKGF